MTEQLEDQGFLLCPHCAGRIDPDDMCWLVLGKVLCSEQCARKAAWRTG